MLQLWQSTKTGWFDAAPKEYGGIEGMGRLLFTKGLAPFELSSALLMVAIVGAVAVARGRSAQEAAELKEKGAGPS